MRCLIYSLIFHSQLARGQLFGNKVGLADWLCLTGSVSMANLARAADYQNLSHIPFITLGKWNLMSSRSNLLPGQMIHATNLIFDTRKNIRFQRISISVLTLKKDDQPDKNAPSDTKIDDRSKR